MESGIDYLKILNFFFSLFISFFNFHYFDYLFWMTEKDKNKQQVSLCLEWFIMLRKLKSH